MQALAGDGQAAALPQQHRRPQRFSGNPSAALAAAADQVRRGTGRRLGAGHCLPLPLSPLLPLPLLLPLWMTGQDRRVDRTEGMHEGMHRPLAPLKTLLLHGLPSRKAGTSTAAVMLHHHTPCSARRCLPATPLPLRNRHPGRPE